MSDEGTDIERAEKAAYQRGYSAGYQAGGRAAIRLPVEKSVGHVEWISRQEWNTLIARSKALMAQAEDARRFGRNADHIWQELCPLNRRIRSDTLKVRGIDDAPPA